MEIHRDAARLLSKPRVPVVSPFLGAAAGLVAGRELVRGLETAAGAVLTRLEERRGPPGPLGAHGGTAEQVGREESA